ncbi:MAG: glycosyltransferase [Pseudomonadota bacterium]
MAKPRIKIVGLMRFSVLTPTYYSERFNTLEETAAHLYSDARMALRFRIFENLVLPTLLMQGDPDFDLVILSGEAMPQKHKDHLAGLLEEAPNIQLRFVGTDDHYPLLKEGYRSIPNGDATHAIRFRLDDDDAVDLNYVGRLRAVGEGLMRINDPDTPIAIAFNRGFYVRFRDGAKNEVFDSCERAPLSTGTAILGPADNMHTPYGYNHRKFAQHYNTYSDISVPAFIRTIHGDNKSSPAQLGITHKMRHRVIARQVRHYFGTTLDVLQAL